MTKTTDVEPLEIKAFSDSTALADDRVAALIKGLIELFLVVGVLFAKITARR